MVHGQDLRDGLLPAQSQHAVEVAESRPTSAGRSRAFLIVGVVALVAVTAVTAFSVGVGVGAKVSADGAVSMAAAAGNTFDVYVIRHAERKWGDLEHCKTSDYGYPAGITDKLDLCQPGNVDAACGGRYLVPNGLERAVCNAEKSDELFGHSDIRQIYAQHDPKCDAGASLREVQTVYPLALKLGLDINIDFSRDDEPKMVDHVYHQLSAEMCGGSAVICWDHARLDLLLQLLGCHEKVCFKNWKRNNFHTYVKFTFTCEADGPSKLVSTEHLEQHVCDNSASMGPGMTKPVVDTHFHD